MLKLKLKRKYRAECRLDQRLRTVSIGLLHVAVSPAMCSKPIKTVLILRLWSKSRPVQLSANFGEPGRKKKTPLGLLPLAL